MIHQEMPDSLICSINVILYMQLFLSSVNFLNTKAIEHINKCVCFSLLDLQPALTDKLGPDFCPQVVASSEILIPAGVSRSFNVSAKNLPNPPKVSLTFFACFEMEKRRNGNLA